MAHNVSAFMSSWFGDELPTDFLDSNVTVGLTAIQLVPNNARRIVLRMSNNGNAVIAVGRDPTVTIATAVVLIAPSQVLLMNVLLDLTDVTRTWWGISSAAGTALHVLEDVMTGQPVGNIS